MFPSIPGFLRKSQKAVLVVALPFAGLIIWRIAGAANPALAHEIEGLVGSLALVIMQIITINVAAVLVLGSVEAVIETAHQHERHVSRWQDGYDDSQRSRGN